MRAHWLIGIAGTMLVGASTVLAHCDTMDGPVVVSAKQALERGDVTPVLRWVSSEQEPAIREAFARTMSVRAKGPDAKELADRYFFETLVRVHRAGEGEPYTGLKPSGTEVEPGIRAADVAMESGSAEQVTQMLSHAIAQGVKQRFEAAHAAAAHADDSVEAGRKAVAAYVQFMHYVESVHKAAGAAAGEHHGPAAAEAADHQSPAAEQHRH